MVDEIKPNIIGITGSWANNYLTDAELGLEGYVMFRKDRLGQRGGGVLLYIKETIPVVCVCVSFIRTTMKVQLDTEIAIQI